MALSAAMLLTATLAAEALTLRTDRPSGKAPTGGASQYEAFVRGGSKFTAPSPRRADPDAEAEVLIDEDFSKMTEGSETELGEDLCAGYFSRKPEIDAAYTQLPGWTGMGVYSAGGQAALYYEGYGGCINTPAREMYGHLHVSFRIKSREGNDAARRAPIFVNCLHGDIYQSQAVCEDNGGQNECMQVDGLYPDQGWVEMNFDMDNPYRGDDCFLQINTGNYNQAGYVVDDVRITRDYDFACRPSQPTAADFTEEGFTVTWTPAAENNGYLFSLVEEKVTGTESESGSEDFEALSAEAPLAIEGWEISLGDSNALSADQGCNGSKALIFDDAADYVITPTNGGRLTGFKAHVWGRAADESSTAYLMLDGWDGMQWKYIGHLFLSDLAPYDGPVGIDLGTMEGLDVTAYTHIKFHVGQLGEGEFGLIDDISWISGPAESWTTLMDEAQIAEPSITLADLDPELEYYFRLRGAKDYTYLSAWTEWQHALGIAAPSSLEAKDVEPENGAYTACWKPAAKALSYTVKNYKYQTIAEDTPDYPVLTDEFSRVVTDGEMTQLGSDPLTLDDYTDIPGWSVTRSGLLYDGAIGVCGFGNLYSPELDLSHNGGNFKVHIVARALTEASMAVQSVSQAQQVDFGPSEGKGPNAWQDVTLEFTDGQIGEKLMFYSLTSNGVFIDKIEVTQDVAKDDTMLTSLYEQEVPECTSIFTGLVPDTDYAFTVQAHGAWRGQTCVSTPSQPCFVQFASNGAREIESADQQGESTYYDMLGRRAGADAKGVLIKVVPGRTATKIVR